MFCPIRAFQPFGSRQLGFIKKKIDFHNFFFDFTISVIIPNITHLTPTAFSDRCKQHSQKGPFLLTRGIDLRNNPSLAILLSFGLILMDFLFFNM